MNKKSGHKSLSNSCGLIYDVIFIQKTIMLLGNIENSKNDFILEDFIYLTAIIEKLIKDILSYSIHNCKTQRRKRINTVDFHEGIIMNKEIKEFIHNECTKMDDCNIIKFHKWTYKVLKRVNPYYEISREVSECIDRIISKLIKIINENIIKGNNKIEDTIKQIFPDSSNVFINEGSKAITRYIALLKKID